MQSPQTPRSYDHQSPTGSAGQSPASHMHMRTPMHKPTDIQGQIQPRNSPSPYSSPGAQSQENNRQLRDLLQQQPQQNAANTFRQPFPPLPPGKIARPQRFVGPQQQQQPPLPQQQQQQHQTVKSVITVQNTPIVGSPAENIGPNVSQQVASTTQPNIVNTNAGEQQQQQAAQPQPQQQQCAPNQSAAEQPQIMDNFSNLDAKLNHADLEKLEEVGDILGDLGEDDDDEFLKSFTADMGVDFNILEYADPELDALDEDQSNLLDSLDFDETEEKEKAKRAALEKLNKANENKAAMSQLKTNLNQTNEQQANAVNSVVSNVAQTSLPNQITQARPPQTQQQMMMQQR